MGFKISKPGFNIGSPKKDLVYTSERDTLKYFPVMAGGVTLSSSSSTITHNLGYVPAFLIWYYNPYSEGWEISRSYSFDLATVDNTELVITGSSGDIFYYVIFINPVESDPDRVVVENNFGMKISKDLIRVDSLNVHDLSFYSGLAHLMEVKTLSFEVEITEAMITTVDPEFPGMPYTHYIEHTSVGVPHGLDYTPGFIGYVEAGSSEYMMLPYGTGSDVTGETATCIGKVDDTNCWISYSSSQSSMFEDPSLATPTLNFTFKLLNVKLE